MQKNKSNAAFALLSVIGILFVVDLHSWKPIGLLNNIFPYNSFFMPMFIFISGYFFKEDYLQKPFRFIGKKIKRLLLPYLIINMIYVGFIILVRQFVPQIQWEYGFHLFTTGVDTILTTPAWFIPSLFFVSIVYFMFRLLFRKWNHFAAFGIFAIIGAVCVWLAQTEWNNDYTVLLLKIGFFLQFYEFGGLFRVHLENKIHRIPKSAVMLSCVLLNCIIMVITHGKIDFGNMYAMTGFETGFYILPLITFLTGTLFWLSAAELLAPLTRNNRLVQFISRHTFGIMFHHLLFFLLLDVIIMFLPFRADQFNYRIFYVNAGWYKADYIEGIRIWYFIFGLVGSLVLCFIYDKCKEKVIHIVKHYFHKSCPKQ